MGSLAFGLFAAWFVDFLAGSARAPIMEVRHSWAPALLGREPATGGLLPLATREVPRLVAPELVTRELADREIAALVAAAKDEEAHLVVLLLLTGVTAQELITLRWDDIDLNVGVIHVGGDAARTILLQEPLRGALVRRGREQPDHEGTVLHDRQGARVAIDEVGRLVLYAADDAGLVRSHEVTPDVLRYTYLSFLLRQGIRAADVDRIVGYIPPNELVADMRRHSPAARRPIEQVERVLPALRALAEKRLIPPAIDQV